MKPASSLVAIALLQLTGVSLAASAGSAPADSLEADFRNPPMAVRPYVWWHWMGPNFSKAGITKDLEAMKAAGIGGATIFNLTSAVQESHAPTENNPWPDQTYRSPKYWEAINHAAAEADRLGLEIGLHNTVGYSTTGGPWIDEERSMQRLVWSRATFTGGAPVVASLPVPAIPPYAGWGKTDRKFSFFRDVAVLAVPAERPEIAAGEVVDLTGRLSPTGELRWDAPPGQWVAYRLGHASTGASPHPVPEDVLGRTLEADKMSLAQTRFHWESVIAPLRQQLGSLYGKSFRHFLIDSYEAGYQSWTPGFCEEFRRRKGYDPLPWLVTMGAAITGNAKDKPVRIVGSAELTARFEYDYREVIAELYFDHGWQPAAEMIHATGVKLQFEPYYGPFNTVEGATVADLPMVEFWTGKPGRAIPAVVGAARAAGHRVIGAEAFTGAPGLSRWTETPASLKSVGDAQFATGVNRMVLHHWVHQPFDDRFKPGMGMGWWGTHFGRNQTWFEPGKEFFRYLGRVQALLQRGEVPVDFVSVGTPQDDGDVISPRDFLSEVKVDDGRIVLPSRRRYALVHVPHHGALPPEMVRQIGVLLEGGATVVSPKPNRSPSLASYPQCDEEVRRLAAELWGEKGEVVRQVGRGRLFTRGQVGEALQQLGITPAAQIVTPGVENVRIAARREGDTELFFVANLNPQPASFTASFGVAGLQPELWDAETGTIELAPRWRQKAGRTEVDLPLGAEKSIFVVFRSNSQNRDQLDSIEAPSGWKVASDPQGRAVISADAALRGTAVFTSGRRSNFELPAPVAMTVTGPWEVALHPAVGPTKTIQLEALQSLSEHRDPDVRYFSGTANYRTTVRLDAALLAAGRRVELKLGDVRDLVRVAVNGRNLGVSWHPPFVRDVTDALHPGENLVELAVTNTWCNRLVGDEQEPPDFEWGTDRGLDKGRTLKGYPAWFVENQPRPSSGRKAWVNFFYYRQGATLIPSGLLGPVALVSEPTQLLVP